jgi:hypothetical protein
MKMIKTKVKTIVLLSIMLMFSGCATFHVSTQSLMAQFIDAQEETKVTYVMILPFFIPFTMTGNDLRRVKCVDKDENEVFINVTNHTGIRITKKDNTRTTFYFNTLIIKDSIINGAKSHFMGMSIKPINLNNIEKIELQK